MSRLVVVVGFCVVMVCHSCSASRSIGMKVSLCSLEVRDVLRTGNASFSLIYSFRVNDSGVPFEVQRVKDEFLRENEVSECIKSWRLGELKGESKVYAIFRWEHGIGWDYVSIRGSDFEKRFNLKDLS